MNRLITQDLVDLQTRVVEVETKTLFYMKQLYERQSSNVKYKSKTLYTATDIAKEFQDIKPCELNRILEKCGLIKKGLNCYFATDVSKCHHYVNIELFCRNNGMVIERYKWTGRGRAYIMTILLELGYMLKD